MRTLASSRIAWLQRLLVGTSLLASLSWWAWCQAAGIGPMWWFIGWSVTLLPHAWILALEFTLLWWVARKPGPVRAMDLIRAWMGEVVAGSRVFAWNQPFRHLSHADQLQGSTPGLTGLVLIHGFVCNRGIWNHWLHALKEEGRPFCAVTLEPVLGSIDAYRSTIQDAVDQVRRATGREPWVVAHSMGGLALRSWLQSTRGDRQIAGAMTIATPHHGTWLARFGLGHNAKQMRLNSPWLQALSASEPVDCHPKFVCVYSDADNIVFPLGTAVLPGAESLCVHGAGHVDLVFRPEPWFELRRRLALSDIAQSPSGEGVHMRATTQ